MYVPTKITKSHTRPCGNHLWNSNALAKYIKYIKTTFNFCRWQIMNPTCKYSTRNNCSTMVTCKQTGVEFLCKLIPDGAPNSAVHPGPLEKLVDWQAWRMRKSSLYKMNYPALAHWTAQIPLEITCDWNTYTAFSREECRVVFYPRKAAEVTQWPREDVRRPVKMESILTSPGRHTKKNWDPRASYKHRVKRIHVPQLENPPDRKRTVVTCHNAL